MELLRPDKDFLKRAILDHGINQQIADRFRIELNPDYLRSRARLTSSSVFFGILKHLEVLDRTFIPSDNPKGVGTSANNGYPTGLNLDFDENSYVSVFWKTYAQDIEDLGASEIIRSMILSRRKVLTPPFIARIKETDDAGNVRTSAISEFDHRFVPFALRNITYQSQDRKQYPPEAFLGDGLEGLAFLHEKGGSHGDLHLGNIGFRYYQRNRPPEVMFVDFETATVLTDDAYFRKNRSEYLNLEQLDLFKNFERKCMQDVGKFVGSLLRAGLPISESEVIDLAVRYYLIGRKQTLFPYDKKEDYADDLWKQIFRSISTYTSLET